jgi:protein NrfC
VDNCVGSRDIGKPSLEISRREFLRFSGIVVIGIGIGGLTVSTARGAMPLSMGYLIVDTKKCQGCMNCMLACSLVHEGCTSLSLARIQVVQNPFAGFPADISLSQCRQCESPFCVAACPVGALQADPQHGYVRTVDKKKCTGCKQCITACPFTPGRTIWNSQAGYAQKCDLCLDTPFWSEKGGPGGKQACVAYCPMQAIQCTDTLPAEYDTMLRDNTWQLMGYSMD